MQALRGTQAIYHIRSLFALLVSTDAPVKGLKKQAIVCNKTPFTRGFCYIACLTALWYGGYTFHQNPLSRGVSLQGMQWNL